MEVFRRCYAGGCDLRKREKRGKKRRRKKERKGGKRRNKRKGQKCTLLYLGR